MHLPILLPFHLSQISGVLSHNSDSYDTYLLVSTRTKCITTKINEAFLFRRQKTTDIGGVISLSVRGPGMQAVHVYCETFRLSLFLHPFPLRRTDPPIANVETQNEVMETRRAPWRVASFTPSLRRMLRLLNGCTGFLD
jgi:hypothetical protein